jgi:hypothetical protein
MSDDIKLIVANSLGKFSTMTVSGLLKTSDINSGFLNAIHTAIKQFIGTINKQLTEIDFFISQVESRNDSQLLYDITVRLNRINGSINNIDVMADKFEQKYVNAPIEPIAHPIENVWPYFIGLDNEEAKQERGHAIMHLVSVAKAMMARIDVAFKRLSEIRKEIIDNPAMLNQKVGEYLSGLKRIALHQESFKDDWQDVYDRYIAKPEEETGPKSLSLEELMAIAPPFGQDTVDREMMSVRAPLSEDSDVEELEEEVPDTDRDPITQPSLRAYKSEPMPNKNEWTKTINPETGLEEWTMKQAMLQLQHVKFVDELKKASSMNDPYLLAAMIAKYSGQIDEEDNEASLKLIAVVEGIVEG